MLTRTYSRLGLRTLLVHINRAAGEDQRDNGVLAVTYADRLQAGWSAAERARQRGQANAGSHIERLLAPLSHDCGLVTVIDGHPATLVWIGAVYKHRVKALGVEHTANLIAR